MFLTKHFFPLIPPHYSLILIYWSNLFPWKPILCRELCATQWPLWVLVSSCQHFPAEHSGKAHLSLLCCKSWETLLGSNNRLLADTIMSTQIDFIWSTQLFAVVVMQLSLYCTCYCSFLYFMTPPCPPPPPPHHQAFRALVQSETRLKKRAFDHQEIRHCFWNTLVSINQISHF